MSTFVDTSAFYAILDRDDAKHLATVAFLELMQTTPGETLLTHNYIVVETAALVQRRLGAEGVRTFFAELLPAVDQVIFVDERTHGAATSAFLAAANRRPSLVDWVSFEVMRDHDLDRAFAFDRDFSAQGFRTVP